MRSGNTAARWKSKVAGARAHRRVRELGLDERDMGVRPGTGERFGFDDPLHWGTPEERFRRVSHQWLTRQGHV